MKRIIIIFLCILAVPQAFAQNSLSLEQCKELALKNNAQVRMAGLSVEIATEQKKEVFTKNFPNISAMSMGFAANTPMISTSMDLTTMMQPMIGVFSPIIMWAMQQGVAIDPDAIAGLVGAEQKFEMLKNGLVAGVQATQVIYAGGQVSKGNRMAQTAMEIRQLQKQSSDNQVLLETERYFWQLVALGEKMKTIENSEQMLGRILSDVEVAVRAGLTTRNDLLRIELELNRLESGRVKLANGIQMQKMTLGQCIGMDADSFELELPDFHEPSLYLPDSYKGPAAPRPEYRMLDKSVEVARLQQELETGKLLPTVAMGAGYTYMNFDLHRDDGMKNDFGMVFASVSVPITDWWGGSSAIKRKKLELQQAEISREESSGLLKMQTRNVQNELNEAWMQIMLAKKSINSATENLKVNQDNYNAGIIALSELLEARNLLQLSRDQYTEALTDYYIKHAEWEIVK